eukprot:TRINITY_DN20955_c0_g1_i1.p1 TRINITY_DN20955_c0_g1~~TRINITY_DN20955_c0_g1_i1.p1  ORF type:complete len:497 (+),score=241.35 TRINITY_DN20955_c0_g1_i1:41-1492(+)
MSMLATRQPVRTGESEGQLKKKAIEAYGAPPDSTVVISASEFLQWKKMMESIELEKAKATETQMNKEKLMKVAAERRARMIAMDEERRANGAVQSIEDLTDEVNRKETLSKAQLKMDEELDEVKYMNKIMLYTKCVTIRDAQIKEKKAIAYEKAEEEKQLDIMMEVERLKALKMYEEREQKRIENRKRGAAVIRAQIEEREQERLRRLELKQQEQDAMLRHIERMKEDDRQEAFKKKEAAKRLMEDVALANAEQIRLKNRQREVEQAEDRRISEYIKEKDTREAEIQAEHDKVKAEKEREIARLRSLQEKAQDKQAELDALRARRAQEAAEREWRQKEKDAAARVAAINADLAQARQSQKLEKEQTLAEQARLENEEFERIIAVQRQWDEQERQKKELEKGRRLQNASDLRSQIEEMEELRRKERRGFLEEGNRLKAQKAAEERKITAIRQRKIDELKNCAVPEKYRHELLKKKNTEPLRPSK